MSDVLKKVEKLIGKPITHSASLGGGCIADTKVVSFDDGEALCVKSGGAASMFPCEAHGLQELAKAGAIRVPKVIHADQNMLVMEHIEAGRPSGNFFEEFGQRLAKQHKYTENYFGFFEDNLIGASPQKNMPQVRYDDRRSQWPEFYFNYRILFQLKLAEKTGKATKELAKLINNLESKIEELLGIPPEPPSLLHGDLWSGNFIVGDNGDACIIDPAVYYGHREAELGMTKLFGGFSPEFYSAYAEVFPLEPGYEERCDLYILYHLLNHFNLFGGGYYTQSISILKRYL